MQLYFQAFSTVIPKAGERPILTPDPWPGFSIGLSNCRPHRRGEIMIRSAESARLSEDRRQRLFAPEWHDVDRRDAGGGEIRAKRSPPSRPWPSSSSSEILPGPSITSDADLIQDFRKRLRHGLPSGLDLPHGPDARAPWSTRACFHGLEGLCTVLSRRRPARHRRLDLSRSLINVISGNTNAAVHHDRMEGRAMVLEDQEIALFLGTSGDLS
jgi:choline dehydrogenase